MSAQHTPGPWSAVEWERHAPTTIVAGTLKLRTVIAEVEGHGQSAEILANARLIAAAPDLLDALRELVANLEEHDERNREPECAVCLAVASGRAAIAKTEGHS